MKKLKNIHPGEVLFTDFIEANLPLNLCNKITQETGIPYRYIEEIVSGQRDITADIDLALHRALGTSKGFWLGLQEDYDLEKGQAG